MNDDCGSRNNPVRILHGLLVEWGLSSRIDKARLRKFAKYCEEGVIPQGYEIKVFDADSGALIEVINTMNNFCEV